MLICLTFKISYLAQNYFFKNERLGLQTSHCGFILINSQYPCRDFFIHLICFSKFSSNLLIDSFDQLKQKEHPQGKKKPNFAQPPTVMSRIAVH